MIVGSFTASYNYASSDNTGTIAAGLASAFNASSASPVTAAVSGAVITLTAKQAGTSGNYSLSTSVSYDNGDFAHASFTATRSGTTLTGGSNGTDGSPGGTPDVIFNNNNQIVGYVYDAAGNVLADGSHTYHYDAENRLISIDNGAQAYFYDGEGHRVKKTPQDNIRMVYGPTGELLAEYDAGNNNLTKEYVYGVGGLLATIDPLGGTQYLTSDHLGTPRVITSAGGTVNSWRDFLPFGEEIAANTGARANIPQYGGGGGGIDNIRQKFTAKERDAETGLDYFGVRYYGSAHGRFTSPDPLMASGRAPIPQSWNRYSYVLNNSLRLIDPSGMIDEGALDEESAPADPEGEDGGQNAKRNYMKEQDPDDGDPSHIETDKRIANVFTDGSGFVRGAGSGRRRDENGDNHTAFGDGQVHTIHIYSKDDEEPAKIFIPKGFTKVTMSKGEFGDKYFGFENPKTHEVIGVAHLEADSAQEVRNRMRTGEKNEAGSSFIGTVPSYDHIHMSIYPDAQARTAATGHKTKTGEYSRSDKKNLGDFRHFGN